MGLEFKSEFDRNPIKQPPSHEQLMLQKLIDSNDSAKVQLDEINQFIDENGLLPKFYMWQEIKAQLRDTSAEVIEDEIIE